MVKVTGQTSDSLPGNRSQRQEAETPSKSPVAKRTTSRRAKPKPVAGAGTGMLVIIDKGLADYPVLVDSVHTGATVVLLEPSQDGIVQITQALQLHPNSTSLHLVSRGNSGCICLGNTLLNLDALDRYGWDVQSWSVPVILLYGSHVAAGESGNEFLMRLHQLTGAAIAASTHLTGHFSLGGTWNLEQRLGKTGIALAFEPAIFTTYQSTFNL
jgi:hypothetical protein